MRNLLKIKRWESGIKQYELAILLGCSSTYLSMVENGRIEETGTHEELLARAGGIYRKLYEMQSF